MSKVEKLDGETRERGKEDVLLGLMARPAASKPKGGSLIQEMGACDLSSTPDISEGVDTAPPIAPQDNGPSMMELMMAAQAQAAGVKAKVKEKEQKQMNKGFGGGFKKGFFGGGGGTNKKVNAKPKAGDSSSSGSSSSGSSSSSSSSIPTLRGTQTKQGVGNIAEKHKGRVLEEVQAAMSSEEAQKLNASGAKEWATPELMQIFASNPILARGLASPKCTAALQALQSSNGPGPNASAAERARHTAQLEQFKTDPEVDVFIREFGRVMATHFEKLGEKQGREQQQQQLQQQLQQQQQQQRPKVEELDADGNPVGASGGATATTAATEVPIGPLQKQALERAAKDKKDNTDASRAKTTVGGSSDEDDKKIKEIVNDPELSALLMDVDMQRILQECGDPRRFQQHMMNPDTARKIKKLFDAGLVGHAR